MAAFLGYCLYDLARQPRTRYLSKPAWALITVLSIPIGGIVYLLLGRSPDALSTSRGR
jgi:Phospholipase_D-nuclease N-terminal